jgi:hypothetical protein
VPTPRRRLPAAACRRRPASPFEHSHTHTRTATPRNRIGAKALPQNRQEQVGATQPPARTVSHGPINLAWTGTGTDCEWMLVDHARQHLLSSTREVGRRKHACFSKLSTFHTQFCQTSVYSRPLFHFNVPPLPPHPRCFFLRSRATCFKASRVVSDVLNFSYSSVHCGLRLEVR